MPPPAATLLVERPSLQPARRRGLLSHGRRCALHRHAFKPARQNRMPTCAHSFTSQERVQKTPTSAASAAARSAVSWNALRSASRSAVSAASAIPWAATSPSYCATLRLQHRSQRCSALMQAEAFRIGTPHTLRFPHPRMLPPRASDSTGMPLMTRAASDCLPRFLCRAAGRIKGAAPARSQQALAMLNINEIYQKSRQRMAHPASSAALLAALSRCASASFSSPSSAAMRHCACRSRSSCSFSTVRSSTQHCSARSCRCAISSCGRHERQTDRLRLRTQICRTVQLAIAT